MVSRGGLREALRLREPAEARGRSPLGASMACMAELLPVMCFFLAGSWSCLRCRCSTRSAGRVSSSPEQMRAALPRRQAAAGLAPADLPVLSPARLQRLQAGPPVRSGPLRSGSASRSLWQSVSGFRRLQEWPSELPLEGCCRRVEGMRPSAMRSRLLPNLPPAARKQNLRVREDVILAEKPAI